MKKDNKIVLACVDQSRFATSVARYAAWAARKLDAPLEFLHVIDRHPDLEPVQDLSGSIGLNAQENLLNQLSDEDEVRSRSRRETGRIFLNQLREQALAAGASSVDVRQRHGHIEETLSEQQADVRLFVLGRRGASAETVQRDLGSNLEWVVRSVSRPTLVVGDCYSEPSRVLMAFDGSGVTRRGVDMIANSPLLRGLPIHIVMAGKAQAHSAKLVGNAQAVLTAAGFSVTTEISTEAPEVAIPQIVQDKKIDLLVMGSYSHSPLRAWLFGSKTSALLRSTKVSTLLLR
ncbi:MAG: universal stress protein [Polaromonas sp.]|nr:universal stress protein [Polaromonas sp.]